MKSHIWMAGHSVITQTNYQHSFVSYFSLYDILLSPPGWWSIFTRVFVHVHNPERNLWEKKFNISVWAVNWNDLWKSAILLSVALHLCLLFFFLNTFSFHVFLSSFLLLENVKCCSKCSCCNAADHRRRVRLYTKTWDTQRLIVDS